MTTKEETARLKMAHYIVTDEARYVNGHIAIYDLPSGDGGGRQEVAGINDRYHPEEFNALAKLIHAGKYDLAQDLAERFILKYTDVVLSWGTLDPGVEYYLRDCVFNRGPTGAARILQHALGVNVDGRVGEITRGGLKTSEPQELLEKLDKSRRWYEESYCHRHPGNKFWNGLSNRWNKVHERSQQLLEQA
jgi:hypothetical protein